MSLPVNLLWQGTDRFPRVSGDEPAIGGMKESFESFSPRERG